MKKIYTLADRMKRYEIVSEQRLTRNIPVIIRLDGKAHHTWTRGLTRPCRIYQRCMLYAAYCLCQNIEGARFSYTQSDEISLLIVDYQSVDSQAWFDYRVQKIVAVSASICTAAFNQAAFNLFPTIYNKKGPAYFDSRVYSIPNHEVCNAFIWRQQDATRNSIQMAGQSHFSHKQLQRKSCNKIQEMLFQEKKINWNDFPTYDKRGTALFKIQKKIENSYRTKWIADLDIPVFTQNRKYIENWVKAQPVYRKSLPKKAKFISNVNSLKFIYGI